MDENFDFVSRLLTILKTSVLESPEWLTTLLVGVVTVIVATTLVKGTGAALRALWMATCTKHDASALAYLGQDESASEFGSVPIFPDSPQYVAIEGQITPHPDPREVLGFVVGRPLWLERTKWSEDEGYYAFVMINWQVYEQFREWTNRGYGIQMVEFPCVSGVDSRHLALSPFSHEERGIRHICEGPVRVLRWQPYRKLGFKPVRLDISTLTWQVKVLSWLSVVVESCFLACRRSILNKKTRKDDTDRPTV